MAQSESDDETADVARSAVIDASRTAVGLLKANQDIDQDFCEHAASMFIKGLTKKDLVHVVAVQNVWLLEQMQFIDRITQGDLSVDEQIIDLGIHVAVKAAFDER